MSDEELFKKVSPIGAILKDVFKEEIEKQNKAIQEIFEQAREELDNDRG